jgi:hypothetical protein
MNRNKRLGFALAAFLAIQPALTVVCGLACPPVRPDEQHQRARSNCHEDVTAENPTRGALIGTSAHHCDHSVLMSPVLLVAKVKPAGTERDSAVVDSVLSRRAEFYVLLRNSHAPPGPTIHSTTVLRV